MMTTACGRKCGLRAAAVGAHSAERGAATPRGLRRKLHNAGERAAALRAVKSEGTELEPAVNLWSAAFPSASEALPHQGITGSVLKALEEEVLDNGEGINALRRFNDALVRLAERDDWERIMEPVWSEMAFNLESFNPVFTACMLKVQCTIGSTNYEARDRCLQRLIQPLAGEYGLHAGEPLDKTHRELFSEWYSSVTGRPLSHILDNPTLKPIDGQQLFARMMSDVSNGGGLSDPVAQASYALGYNLAVEYLAHPEKTWLLESFQRFSAERLEPCGRHVAWKFLEVHALGEEEHAAIGHEAVTVFVPESHAAHVRQAMRDHDRDFAIYYNALADLIDVTQ